MENAQPGHTVEFHGLRGAAHLNGTSGHLVRYLEEEQRWAVRCDDTYKIVNAKPANLKRTHVAPVNSYFTHPVTGQTMVPKDSTPVTEPSDQIQDLKALHEAVLNAFYTLRKGGVVVSCGSQYMIAVEFDGPAAGGGIQGEMVFVDTDASAQAVVKGRKCERATELGRNFLTGETVAYYDTTEESVFFSLLRKYRSAARSRRLIDMKSGLSLYDVTIAK
mmetsp:Transcript_802/g.1504  ORF Transcript_802/g.1504 Transcript_802/m.1504 type:complete len:219 (+) Transcript_802:55-711(+)